MSYRTILVHCDASETVAHRLGVAVTLAGRFDAQLIGLYNRPQFEPPILVEGGVSMGRYYTAFKESAKADEAAALAAFNTAVGPREASSEWRAVNGIADIELVASGCYADLVIVGQADPNTAKAMATPSNLAESVALSASAPVMVIPFVGARSVPGKTVLLCWKETREAARAASAALPILKSAEKVIALVVREQGTFRSHTEPGAALATWLRRHGVSAFVRNDANIGQDIGALILSCAAEQDVDLIVMGAYGRSRLRELILGGASRTLLRGTKVSLLMAH